MSFMPRRPPDDQRLACARSWSRSSGAASFNPIWFGVIITINMEIGLIHPPVGLNTYIASSIAPDVPLTRIIRRTPPFVVCMMLQIVLLCIFPEIATWLPTDLMGPGT